MSSSSNWKDLLQSQNDEINRLEAVDQDIDNNVMSNLNNEIDNIIKKKSSIPPPAVTNEGRETLTLLLLCMLSLYMYMYTYR